MSDRLRVLSVVGTRPNLMKTVPVVAALRGRAERFECVLVNTGQHYDHAMFDIFMEELGVEPPEHMLGVGSGTHAEQTARVMERLEPIVEAERPDLLLVPGDVNSTAAAALVAAKAHVAVGHIEAGLRSFDRSMPEEVNRLVTDSLSGLLFTHSPEARENLIAEGHPSEHIHAVGNTMVDTLERMLPRIREHGPDRHGLEPGAYLVVTLHRPALTDGPLLAEAFAALGTIASQLPVLFPVHPRTRKRAEQAGLATEASGLRLLEPLGYLDFLGLVAGSAGVLTDSGGIQEETTHLGIPCFTLRDNTERPVTVDRGTNTLLGLRPERIREIPALIERSRGRPAPEPIPGWDGRAAERIAEVLAGWSSPLGTGA